MEPEVAAFLKRILTTIGIVLFWMCVNSTAGIMFGYAFIDDKIKIGNVLFYIWLVIASPLLFIWLRKMWSEEIEFDR
ncbi:MAG: hypothetical protein H7101_06095 [Deinococcales bacterium]|nr:hypothetical protein [Chitinophagaceae bacterium]